MNILPKKRWHVRTKENIARVRKDEAEAAEKERQEKLRIDNADREARLNILKHKSKQKLLDSGIESKQLVETPIEHINFFTNLDHAVNTTNKEHENEVKEKKEDYEKKIGYLTYLGQDTNEALGKKNWYEVAPGSSRTDIKDTYEKLVLKDPDGKPKQKQLDIKNGETGWKSKQQLDPINAFKKYCTKKDETKCLTKDSSDKKVESILKSSSHKYKHKKHEKNKDEKKEKLLKMREERLKREQQEKAKTKLYLAKLNGEQEIISTKEQSSTTVKPKYNSQFNPELARQNYRT